MALGAYSTIRYSNNLNDQRVNLGVILWHPLDGFSVRISPYLDRVSAIDPRVRVKPLKVQLDSIKDELAAPSPSGREKLTDLASWFREGLEVTEPYPARISSLAEAMDRLYEQLVSPVTEISRASSQRQFERGVERVLRAAVKQLDPKAKCENIGKKALNGVQIDVGFRTTIRRHTALWRALSLQAKDNHDDQIAKAKATALDIGTIRRSFAEFKNARQVVSLQPPKPRASQHLADVLAWLKRDADDVVVVPDVATMSQLLETKLRELT